MDFTALQYILHNNQDKYRSHRRGWGRRARYDGAGCSAPPQWRRSGHPGTSCWFPGGIIKIQQIQIYWSIKHVTRNTKKYTRLYLQAYIYINQKGFSGKKLKCRNIMLVSWENNKKLNLRVKFPMKSIRYSEWNVYLGYLRIVFRLMTSQYGRSLLTNVAFWMAVELEVS